MVLLSDDATAAPFNDKLVQMARKMRNAQVVYTCPKFRLKHCVDERGAYLHGKLDLVLQYADIVADVFVNEGDGDHMTLWHSDIFRRSYNFLSRICLHRLWPARQIQLLGSGA